MLKIPPKWILKRYAILWKKFGEKKFSFENAQEALNEDARVISLFLSELNKAGWIEKIEPHPDDARKRLYKLIPMKKGFERAIEQLSKSG